MGSHQYVRQPIKPDSSSQSPRVPGTSCLSFPTYETLGT